METVMTVRGPVDAKDLGKTLSHEHIFCDFTCFLLPAETEEAWALLEEPVTLENLWSMRINPYANRDNCRLDSIETALREIDYFKRLGGGTITEVSLDGCGRDVARLAAVSAKAGVNIVCGTGHYIHPTHPPIVQSSTADALARIYIDEIRNGVGETGIRPGIIGEIGTSAQLHPQEEKVLRGAARAQRETGLALTVHLDPAARCGHEVLDILVGEEGVKAQRIILGHTEFALTHQDLREAEGLGYIMSLADRGCMIEFDLCGNTTVYRKEHGFWVLPTDYQRTKAIFQLCLRGYGSQILLSHDQGLKHFLRSYGGWGYGHVLGVFQDYLAEAGIAPRMAKSFIIDNPARVLTIDQSASGKEY